MPLGLCARLLVTLVGATLSGCVPATATRLETEWEYSWTEDPHFRPEPNAVWRPLDIRRPPEDRGTHQLMRLRRRLPQLPPTEPALFLFGIDQIFEVRTHRGQIYSFGDLRPDKRAFPGFMKRHYIPLEPEDAGGYITFHIFADWSNIGFSAVPLLGTMPELRAYGQAIDFDLACFAIFFLVTGLIALFFFLRYSHERLPLWFAAVAIGFALFTFYHTQIKYQVWESPTGWAWVAALTAFALPLPLNAFYRHLFLQRYAVFFNASLVIFGLFLVYAIIVLSICGVSRFYQDFATRPFSVLCAISYVSLLALGLRELKHGNREAGPITLGLVVVLLNGLPHLAYEARWVSQTHFRFHWGMGFYVLCLGWLVGRKYSRTYEQNETYAQDLAAKNEALRRLLAEKTRFGQELEARVAERSEELERAHRALLEESVRASAMERQLALRTQKDAILSDLHDRMGAVITDLSIAADRLLPGPQPDDSNGRDTLDSIIQLSQEMRVSFRSLVDEVADFHMMSEDFLAGLHMRLLRRYANAGRRLHFSGQGHSNGNPLGPGLSDFCHIVEEICTNDLKYGTGTSAWSATVGSVIVLLEMTAEVKVLPVRVGRGRGTITIRAAKLKARFADNVSDGRYSVSLEVPLAPAEKA